MANITKKDIISFAKVVQELGALAEEQPDALLEFIRISTGQPTQKKTEAASEYNSERVKDLDLYDYARTHSAEEMSKYLGDFSAEELRGLIKKYNLGYTKLKSAEAISTYIADQMKKRTTDVFLQHEK